MPLSKNLLVKNIFQKGFWEIVEPSIHWLVASLDNWRSWGLRLTVFWGLRCIEILTGEDINFKTYLNKLTESGVDTVVVRFRICGMKSSGFRLWFVIWEKHSLKRLWTLKPPKSKKLFEVLTKTVDSILTNTVNNPKSSYKEGVASNKWFWEKTKLL